MKFWWLYFKVFSDFFLIFFCYFFALNLILLLLFFLLFSMHFFYFAVKFSIWILPPLFGERIILFFVCVWITFFIYLNVIDSHIFFSFMCVTVLKMYNLKWVINYNVRTFIGFLFFSVSQAAHLINGAFYILYFLIAYLL